MSSAYVTRRQHENAMSALREAHDVLCRTIAFELDQVLLRLAALEKGEVATPSDEVPQAILDLEERAKMAQEEEQKEEKEEKEETQKTKSEKT